jgi:ssDNA-binding Zn-finger/Zn-ribbon topoisomerase 1
LKAELIWRRARDREIRGEFLGCSRYPACQYIENPKKATMKQVNYLVQLGWDLNEAKKLTISQASDRISRGSKSRNSSAIGPSATQQQGINHA